MDATSIAGALLGRTRAAILSFLFEHPDEWFHLRQIARETRASPGTTHRELGGLVDLGLILRDAGDVSVRFKANIEAAIFPELKSLLAKTAGASQILRAGLATLGESVQTAFIYGSVARGEEHAGSDIDLMIIGTASLAAALKALQPAMEALRRTVNPTVYSPDEFASKAQRGHAFVQRVIAEPKIYLVGGMHELGQSGQDREAASSRAPARRDSKAAARAGSKPRRRASRRA